VNFRFLMAWPGERRHVAVMVDNLGRFLKGRPLRNVVDKAQRF
jgi:hypothetical protein